MIAASGRLPLAVQWVLGIAISVSLGVLVATANMWPLLAVALPLVAWLAYRYPPVTVIAFWGVYLLHTTVFADAGSVQGMYYPLYLLMGANLVSYLSASRDQVDIRPSLWLTYAAFFGAVCLSLLWQPPGVLVSTANRLFIYSMGLLTAIQIRTVRHVKASYMVLIAGGLTVAVWTIVQARTAAFGYRGGIGINENYVATLIGYGIIPLFAALTDQEQKWHPIAQLATAGCLMGGTYATLLLASRGVTAAIIAAAVVILIRNGVKTPGRMLLVVLAAVVCIALLFQLPGAENIIQRLTEANTDSFNDRIPLWMASLRSFTTAPMYQQLLGGGMGASEVLVHSVNPLYLSLHNGYLQILFDFGLVGLLLFSGLLFMTYHAVSKRPGYIGSAGTGVIAFTLMALLSATLADGFLFWIAVGITLAASNRRSV